MKIIKKMDIVIIIMLVFISFIPYGMFYINNSSLTSNEVYAKITVDGDLFREIRLDNHVGEEQFKVESKDGYNLIKIVDNKIAIIDADCKDKVCENVGYISKVGQTAVCLPHKVVIEIKGSLQNNSDEEDFISG